MKRTSIEFKITLAFIAISIVTLLFLYFTFHSTFKQKMLESEKEKALLIAKTIEPMIAMSNYLGMKDDIKQLAKQTLDNNYIGSVQIIINNKNLFSTNHNHSHSHLHIEHPIKDPISNKNIGFIDIDYKLDNFNQTLEEVQYKILYYLVALGIIFLIFALYIKYQLSPLMQIAKKVQSYKPGVDIDFSSIRTELETDAIVQAFNKMLSNIKEYTNLLERYKYAVDESNIVSKTDLYGTITYVNEEFTRLSGYSKEELIGNGHNILHHQDMDKNTFHDLWQKIQDKKVWKGTIKNRRKDNTTYYVRLTIVPIFNDIGETIEYIAIGQDISKIVEKDQEIKTERQKLDDILNHIDSIVSMSTEDGKLVFINKKFFDYFSFADFENFKDKYGCICNLFVERDDYIQKDIAGVSWVDYIYQNTEQSHKVLMVDKFGFEKIFDIQVQMIETSDEKLFVTTLSDITELERVKDEAQNLAKIKGEFLANMSHEIRTPMNGIFGFTKLLKESELDRRQQYYLDIIDSSSKNLMHIINDILDFSKLESGKFELDPIAINPFIELEKIAALFIAKMDEKNIKFNRVIEYSIPECFEIDLLRLQQVLSNLIGNALKFTPENGEITFYVKLISLENENIQIRFGVKDNGIGISDDKQKHIFEAFSQADNTTTREFGGTGLGLSISSGFVTLMGSQLNIESEENVGSNFYFDVSVNSCMSENVLSRFFDNLNIIIIQEEEVCAIYMKSVEDYLERFQIRYTVSSKNQPLNNNSIYIVFEDKQFIKRLSDNHISTIVINEELENSIVSNDVTYMKNIDHDASELYNILLLETKKLGSIGADTPIIDNRGNVQYSGNILVAEDNEVNQLLIQELLNANDLNHVIVENGVDAIAMLKKDVFDLIFMDINMPVMGGIEAMNNIKAMEIKTPVIALTANAMGGDKNRFLELGFDSYLSKPIVHSDFLNILNNYLDSTKKQVSKKVIIKNENSIISFEKMVNMEEIKEALQLPDEILKKLLLKYSDTIDTIISTLRESVKKGDFDEISEIAHSIKGSAGNLHFKQLQTLALKIENSAKLHEEIDYVAMVDSVEKIVFQIKQEITNILSMN